MSNIESTSQPSSKIALDPVSAGSSNPSLESYSTQLSSVILDGDVIAAGASEAAESETKLEDTAISALALSDLGVDGPIINATLQSGASELNNIVASVYGRATLEMKTGDTGIVAAADTEVTFEMFPKFPPEIRLKIWKLAPQRRLVLVCFSWDGRKKRYKFVATIPEILHTCRESRHEGLKFYHRVFDSKWANNGVYFDFDMDIFGLYGTRHRPQRDFFLQKVKPIDMNRVQKLFMTSSENIRTLLSKFPAVKEVFYSNSDRCHYRGVYDLAYFHPLQRPICSDANDGLHTVDSVLKKYSRNQALHEYMEEKSTQFTTLKEEFMKSELGSQVTLHHRVVCRWGWKKESLCLRE